MLRVCTCALPSGKVGGQPPASPAYRCRRRWLLAPPWPRQRRAPLFTRGASCPRSQRRDGNTTSPWSWHTGLQATPLAPLRQSSSTPDPLTRVTCAVSCFIAPSHPAVRHACLAHPLSAAGWLCPWRLAEAGSRLVPARRFARRIRSRSPGLVPPPYCAAPTRTTFHRAGLLSIDDASSLWMHRRPFHANPLILKLDGESISCNTLLPGSC